MVLLHVRLSNFRLSAPPSASLPPATSLAVWSTTRRICGVECAAAAAAPITSLRADRPLDQHSPNSQHLCLAFPPTWGPTWTESLPDRLALRAAALHVEARSPPRAARFKRLTCTPKRRVPLGAVRLDFLTLSTGTVCQSRRLVLDHTPTPYTLSFEVVVNEPARVALAFADLRLWLDDERETSNPVSVSVQHVGGKRVQSAPLACQSPASDAQDSEKEGHDTEEEEHDAHGDHHARPRQRPLSGDSLDPPDCSWSSLPPLHLRSSNLTQLAHGVLRIRVHSCRPDGTRSVLAQDTVPVHRIWAALAHPGHRAPLSLHLSETVILQTTVCTDRQPPLGQMSGGVTTDDGITGAHPVIFGAPLSDTLQVSTEAGLPPGWVRLVDSFGYRYYRHVKQAVDVWTLPPDETISEAIRFDELRAQQHGFERGKYGVFRSQADGSETWIHPAATRTSISAFGVPSDTPATPSALESEISFSTLDMSELRTDVVSREAHQPRVRSDLHPATFTHITRPLGPSDDPTGYISRTSQEMPRGNIVEMSWKQLSAEAYAPGVKCEGHTLTAVNSGKTLLKFGGATGSGGMRLNTLDAFDVERSRWQRVEVSGVLPAARTGHSAVALGSDLSRLLIFGGSSPQGRRNDLHMYHVANETWSPITFTGTPPEIRARMGMTVAADGSTALVFGGRSLYRFLGGQYYDAHYVNAFHAERSQWVRMRPQGSGPRPAPRSGCVVEFINNRQMFVHGGYDDGDRFFGDTFLFDMVSSSWQELAYPDEPRGPSPREGHASTMLGDNVLVYGGDSRNGLLSDMHVFDSNTLRWEESPSQVGLGPGRICGAGLAAIGDSEALLVGGDIGFGMTRAAYSLGVSRRSTIDARGMKELAMERGPDAGLCVVCMDAKVETMFLWCGHSVCCRSCSRLVKRVCPVCRLAFSEIVHSRFE